MSTLYDVAEELAAWDALIDERDGNITDCEQILESWLAEIEVEFDEKLRRCVEFVQELKAREAAQRAEADRLYERAMTSREKWSRITTMMQGVLEQRGITKRQVGPHSISLQRAGGKLSLLVDVAPAQLPERFQKVQRVADNDAIRSALESGEALEFARFAERKITLRIS